MAKTLSNVAAKKAESALRPFNRAIFSNASSFAASIKNPLWNHNEGEQGVPLTFLYASSRHQSKNGKDQPIFISSLKKNK